MALPIIGLTTARVQAPNQSDQLATPLSYIQAVINAGGIPLLIPAVLSEDQLRETFGHLDGILLTGGGDIDPALFKGQPHPRVYGIDADRDRTEIALVKLSVAESRPFLGICRGIQVINVALGGTLFTDIEGQMSGSSRHDFYPDIPRNHLAHEVTLSPASRLAQVMGGVNFQVNSLHHQGLQRIAPGLQITAQASDGLVEGVELPSHPFGVGVQWHPEWLQEHEAQRALFKAFIQAAFQAL